MIGVDEIGFMPKKEMLKCQRKIEKAIFEMYPNGEAEDIFEALIEMETAWSFSRCKREEKLEQECRE